MNFFACILNAKIIILRQKDLGCSKFLWKDIRKESSMFCLRNWSYLITSSSLSTLLLDILIFHSDVCQCLFCFLIGCIQQLHWLIILSNNIFRFGVELFSTPKRKKKFPVQGKEIILFLVGALKNFPVRGKVSKVVSGL